MELGDKSNRAAEPVNFSTSLCKRVRNKPPWRRAPLVRGQAAGGGVSGTNRPDAKRPSPPQREGISAEARAFKETTPARPQLYLIKTLALTGSIK